MDGLLNSVKVYVANCEVLGIRRMFEYNHVIDHEVVDHTNGIEGYALGTSSGGVGRLSLQEGTTCSGGNGGNR